MNTINKSSDTIVASESPLASQRTIPVPVDARVALYQVMSPQLVNYWPRPRMLNPTDERELLASLNLGRVPVDEGKDASEASS